MPNHSKSSQISPIKKLIIPLFIALIGLFLSVYATIHHREVFEKGQTSAACNVNAVINCDAVALSSYSELWNIPLGVWGVSYFFALSLLLLLSMCRPVWQKSLFEAYKLFVYVGVIASVVLGSISIGLLKVGCINCISIYIVTLAQLIFVLTTKKTPLFAFTKNLLPSFVIFAALMLALPFIYNQVLPAPVKETVLTPPPIAQKKYDIPFFKSKYAKEGEDYRRGNDEAKVVIQTFSDFQCPACKRMAARLDELATEFGDKILIVYRNYPLDSSCNPAMTNKLHEHACQVATLARCAGAEQKFWEFHNLAFQNQESISKEASIGWAKQIGLSDASIASCLKDQDILNKIRADIQLASQLGVNATPTIYINGRQYMGSSHDNLRTEIENLINAPDVL